MTKHKTMKRKKRERAVHRHMMSFSGTNLRKCENRPKKEPARIVCEHHSHNYEEGANIIVGWDHFCEDCILASERKVETIRQGV